MVLPFDHIALVCDWYYRKRTDCTEKSVVILCVFSCLQKQSLSHLTHSCFVLSHVRCTPCATAQLALAGLDLCCADSRHLSNQSNQGLEVLMRHPRRGSFVVPKGTSGYLFGTGCGWKEFTIWVCKRRCHQLYRLDRGLNEHWIRACVTYYV